MNVWMSYKLICQICSRITTFQDYAPAGVERSMRFISGNHPEQTSETTDEEVVDEPPVDELETGGK